MNVTFGFNGKVEFSEAALESIAASLPEPITDRRRNLLSQVLQEWGRTFLIHHLTIRSPAAERAWTANLRKLRDQARDLLPTIDKLDDRAVTNIAFQANRHRWRGESDLNKVRTELEDSRTKELTKLEGLRTDLAQLAAFVPQSSLKLSRGRPRNEMAFNVVFDAAAIYEWYSGRNATRVWDWKQQKETGPFQRFAAALWPPIFGKGIVGLPAALRNWADDKDGEKHSWLRLRSGGSTLMVYLDSANPKWRLFEPNVQ